jgi:hypothetical protein
MHPLFAPFSGQARRSQQPVHRALTLRKEIEAGTPVF